MGNANKNRLGGQRLYSILQSREEVWEEREKPAPKKIGEKKEDI
jgi:hypothetical protein